MRNREMRKCEVRGPRGGLTFKNFFFYFSIIGETDICQTRVGENESRRFRFNFFLNYW